MIIKLKGNIHPELRNLGYKPGDIIENACACPVSKVGAVHFEHRSMGSTQYCVVWPENYEVIKADKPKKPFQFTIT